MIRLFGSVGANYFDVTWTNAAGKKQLFRGGKKTDELTRALPAMLDDAERRQRNVIVRPRGRTGITFVQLDDLGFE